MKVSAVSVRYKNVSNWSVAHLLANRFDYNGDFRLERIGDFLTRNKTRIIVEDETLYKRVTIRLYNKGVKLRDEVMGKEIGTKKQFLIRQGQFLMSKIDARNGAFGVATDEVDNAIITADFFAYDIDENKIIPQFLVLLTTTNEFQRFAQSTSSGTTGRQRMDEKKFLDVKVPLPSLQKQLNILAEFNKKKEIASFNTRRVVELERESEQYFESSLGIVYDFLQDNSIMTAVRYVKLRSWSVKDLKDTDIFHSELFPTTSFGQDSSLIINVFRGKSPVYSAESNCTILNQKCNRWNSIELAHAKTVDENWYKKINDIHFTKEGDVLINSTGEGTIGRASIITKEFEGLMYDSHLLLLRVDQNLINPLFVTYFINSRCGQRQITVLKSAIATKQTELGIDNLKKIVFVLPPLEVQNEIVVKLKYAEDQINALKTSYTDNESMAIEEFENKIFNR